MSQAQSSNEFASNEGGSGFSLASVTVGIIAAALFLLISSYLSNDASWNIPSDRAWASTGLTGNDLSATAWPTPATEQLRAMHPKSHNYAESHNHPQLQDLKSHNHLKSPNDEAAHFSDALYSADFMNSSPEPT